MRRWPMGLTDYLTPEQRLERITDLLHAAIFRCLRARGLPVVVPTPLPEDSCAEKAASPSVEKRGCQEASRVG